MGDLSDMNDLDRVMRSPEGKAMLEEIRAAVIEHKIVCVEFINEVRAIAVLLGLDNGRTLPATDPSLEVESLREKFPDVIRREYLADYPERRTEDDGA
ncbi:MAG: hypothetical protein QG656_1939 [Candidatus Hydrogenedentes bacterium]|nr:hypothetical protein [Candidatus Hydrogenedentota bacterium]